MNPFATLLTGQANINAPMMPGQFPFNPFMFPTMPPPPPIPPAAAFTFPPPPIMPNALDQLSEEELRLLEGNERRNVEERIKVIRAFS